MVRGAVVMVKILKFIFIITLALTLSSCGLIDGHIIYKTLKIIVSVVVALIILTIIISIIKHIVEEFSYSLINGIKSMVGTIFYTVMFCLFLWVVPKEALLSIEKHFPKTIPYFEKIEFIKEFNTKRCKEMQKEAINDFRRIQAKQRRGVIEFTYIFENNTPFFSKNKKCKVPKIIKDNIDIIVPYRIKDYKK